MSKRFITINGTDFYHMVLLGAQHLQCNVERINGLNVFPVPDGDTGTNMNMTMASGVEALNNKPHVHIGKAADVLSKGLLMGARGNSGVILSQLFRGFAKAVHDYEEIQAPQFAAALQQGVDTAYKAVVKPVEGTILTVSKEAARHAIQIARRTNDIVKLMEEVLLYAQQSLDRTPELLPVLKQVGVVDAGGQGLICIYEGFLAALLGEMEMSGTKREAAAGQTDLDQIAQPFRSAHAAHIPHAPQSAQSMLAAENIEFGYCTEFLVKRTSGKVRGRRFDEAGFRRDLAKFGDSLLVVADEDLVKVHIHAEYPGEVMNYAMKYGDLTGIKIENMREQHSHILMGDAQRQSDSTEKAHADNLNVTVNKPYGFVAVAMGKGIADIFTSLGVDVVLSGGQTMNPSTEDIVNAMKQISADSIYILPNNSNIVLAAQQAKDLLEERLVTVIPSKTIPQGIAAMLAYEAKSDIATNTESMQRALDQVQSGQITYAVRDTTIDGLAIHKDDFLGIHNQQIVTANPILQDTCKLLLDSMLADGGDMVTILSGMDAAEAQTAAIVTYLEGAYPQVEIEMLHGDQPLYTYIFSVE